MARRWVILMSCLGVASSAWAHHAFDSEFDKSQAVKLVGVVQKVVWINPHVYVYLDVKAADGAITTWSIETFPPAFWRKVGVTKAQIFNDGQTVTVLANPGKRDPSRHLAFLQRMTRPDGTFIQAEGFVAQPTEQ